jgi:hypothetical protein
MSHRRYSALDSRLMLAVSLSFLALAAWSSLR